MCLKMKPGNHPLRSKIGPEDNLTCFYFLTVLNKVKSILGFDVDNT